MGAAELPQRLVCSSRECACRPLPALCIQASHLRYPLLLPQHPCSNAAEHLVGLMLAQPGERRWRGVCFFDEGRRVWMVLDLQRRLTPREVSPIREDQALCVFDEARCRGADLRLRPDALGLLTLGPATCKDKLMQAGRGGVVWGESSTGWGGHDWTWQLRV